MMIKLTKKGSKKRKFQPKMLGGNVGSGIKEKKAKKRNKWFKDHV
jgi:hypothetical protein